MVIDKLDIKEVSSIPLVFAREQWMDVIRFIGCGKNYMPSFSDMFQCDHDQSLLIIIIIVRQFI